MHRRALACVALLAVGACHRGQPKPLATADANANAVDADPDRVPCAHGGEALATACTIDREEGERGLVLTLRHPDGAFHRLLVTRDGRGVVAADGAEAAAVTLSGGNQIDVAIGGDRYRLPATVRGPGR